MPDGAIRDAGPEDAGPICAIYNHYVTSTTVSFEEEPVSVAEMAARIRDIGSARPWILWEEGGLVLGYAYAGTWKQRSAYRRTVETSIYLAPEARGRGIGRILYTELLRRLRDQGVHAVLGGIAQPNEASVRLHEALGFTEVGRLREVGFKFGRPIDVGYWELILGA